MSLRTPRTLAALALAVAPLVGSASAAGPPKTTVKTIPTVTTVTVAPVVVVAGRDFKVRVRIAATSGGRRPLGSCLIERRADGRWQQAGLDFTRIGSPGRCTVEASVDEPVRRTFLRARFLSNGVWKESTSRQVALRVVPERR
jgi:hypothetical protein